MVLSVMTTLPLAFSASLGDDWSSITSSLSSGEKSEIVEESLSHLADARFTYEHIFKDAAIEVDVQSNVLIETAFDDIENNLKSGDIEMASLNRQVVDKTIYKIAFMKMETAVDTNNSVDFVNWYSVLEKKFKITEVNYDSNLLVNKIISDSSTLPTNGPLILDELLSLFQLKTIEELEEAAAGLEEGDVKSAKKFTYEGLYYYRTLHPAVEDKLGTDSANELLHKMEDAIRVTMSDQTPVAMKSEIEHIASDVELLIREYEGGDTSNVGLALSGIKDRLNLVEIEYLDAVDNGKIINQVEYDETVVFLEKATSIFTSVKQSLIELSESDATSLENNLMEINSIVSAKGKTSEVSILVGKSLNNVASLETLAGGAVEVDILQYFDEIERLLTEAKTVYRNGDSSLAFDLVSEAYLDNYEFVEGPLGEVDHDLMEKIENDMRVDLRNMITTKESPDVIDAQVDKIMTDLAAAKKVVPEFGTITIMVLAIAIISIIALSSKSKLGLLPKL